ncbi:MAG: 16S rRNA (cytosine(1402)-N(4))-methyltransferase RsmH [Pirellulales bacterium]|nr:16S rRNA (cytosine(1402)-N(4))-methyltransferase RsmH [Pirellulales bacterium]
MAAGGTQHVPVLLAEVLAALDPQPGQTIVDGTVGGGGHAEAIADRVGPTGLVVGLDRDPLALERVEQRLAGRPVKLIQANYSDLPELLAQLGISGVHGVLLDLGLSSDQLADPERGFSFASSGPLDLRFNPLEGEPAWRLVERLSAEHLQQLFSRYGEERFSPRIARRIVEVRRRQPIRTSAELAELVCSVVPRSHDTRIHPATRVFQALRIAVNDELRWLEIGLRRIVDCLLPGGRLAIISFHSLEDRRVKEAFRDDARLDVVTRHPVTASPAELGRNPRARSAKLRVALRKPDATTEHANLPPKKALSPPR